MKPKLKHDTEDPLPEPEVRIEESEFWSIGQTIYRGKAAFAELDKMADKMAQPDYQKNRNLEVIESYREYANWILENAGRFLEMPYRQRRRLPLSSKDLARLTDKQMWPLVKDARDVLSAADHLLEAINLGNNFMHIAIDAAMRLQEAHERLLVRRHELNAATGRLHRERSKEGADVRNAERPLNPLGKKIRKDWLLYLVQAWLERRTAFHRGDVA